MSSPTPTSVTTPAGATPASERGPRFTARGGEEVEREIRDLVERVGRRVARACRPNEHRALVLLGGYGRGEGGVLVRDGVERAHNNLDFLLVTRGLDAPARRALQERLEGPVRELAAGSGIGIDLTLISESRLRRSPCLVMWYDMRHGHRTVLGDADFVPSLSRFRLDRVLSWDVRNLLVNRGTLFLVGDLLLDRGRLSESERKMVVKLAMKAIIGYGDALLYFLGDYHWSYLEKQRRMRGRQDVDPDIRALYDDAMEFRFQPDYEPWLERDLAAWTRELRSRLAGLHLQCERARLGRPDLQWEDYPDAALRHALLDQPISPRATARKLVNLLRPELRHPGGGSSLARLGCRAAGARGVLPTLFPVIAYELEAPGLRELARGALGAESADVPELRRAYLRTWSVHGDVNFPAVLSDLGLSLEAVGDEEPRGRPDDGALGVGETEAST